MINAIPPQQNKSTAAGIDALRHAAVGRPISRLGISFFPIYTHQPSGTSVGSGIEVSELAQASVPTLLARNPGDSPVLLIEGETLHGGQQHRTLNVSVLVPATSEVELPVSCVEEGRWQHGQSSFRRGRVHTTSAVRTAKLEGVGRTRSRGSRQGDQGAVWDAVRSELHTRDTVSSTGSYHDIDNDDRLEERYQRAVRSLVRRGPLPAQNGAVIAKGPEILGVDVFSNADLLADQWEAMVRTALFEAGSERQTRRPTVENVIEFLTRIADAKSENFDAVALGREVQIRSERIIGQALTLDDLIVHASAFAIAA